MESSLPDSTPELRAAYQRFLEGRGPMADHPCPDPEDLLPLAAGVLSAADRLRTLDHVAQCPQCRREFDLLRAVAGTKPKPKARVRPWMAAAASVAILFGAGYGVWIGVNGGRDPVLRGPESSVELLSPASGQEGVGLIDFQWRPISNAYEYIFEILGQEGESLHTHTTSETSYRMDLAQQPALEGDRLWWVRARLRDGTELSSPTRPIGLSRR